MKIQDFDTIFDEVCNYIVENGSFLLDYFNADDVAKLITDAYRYNDSAVEVTTHLCGLPTVIFTTYRCSFIYDGHSSYFKQGAPLCQYNDLKEDIEALFVCADAAFLRYKFNAE